jgi:hypothetical protein
MRLQISNSKVRQRPDAAIGTVCALARREFALAKSIRLYQGES